ncbi:PH domain-containing protein [Alkalihalobacillus sp. 1P02AB]|uniref:PH domain-containing protein n=1 Tax=Alkalihalobacillus sp. 1P02AB TaxID=3132260 RepID=UPI0039A4BE84
MRRDEPSQGQTNQGQRLHPLWIPFSILKSIKELLIPIILFFFVNAGEPSMFTRIAQIGVGLIFLYMLISLIFKWINFRYSFSGDELRVNEGRFIRKKRFVQLERIQGVQMNTHFLQRPFGLTTVTLDTAASSSDSSIKLECIKREDALWVKDYIATYREKQKEVHVDERSDEWSEEPILQDDKKLHYQIRPKEIVFAAFTSMSVLALVPILFGFLAQLSDVLSIDEYVSEAYQFISQTWTFILFAILVLLVISLLFGLITTFLTYGNYQVETNEERIFVKKGVLSQTEWTIAKNKVQAVKFTKTFLRRWFGIVGVELVCAGAYGDEKVESTMLFPFISEKRARAMLPEVLPTFKIEEGMRKLPKQALFVKLMRPSYFWLIASAVLFYFWIERWYLSPILLVLIIFLRYIDYRHSGHGLFHPFIQMRSGAFSVEMVIAEKKKIEEVGISQSKLQKLFGLSTLTIATRGTPVHFSSIQDVPLEEAYEYYDWYQKRLKKQVEIEQCPIQSE